MRAVRCQRYPGSSGTALTITSRRILPGLVLRRDQGDRAPVVHDERVPIDRHALQEPLRRTGRARPSSSRTRPAMAEPSGPSRGGRTPEPDPGSAPGTAASPRSAWGSRGRRRPAAPLRAPCGRRWRRRRPSRCRSRSRSRWAGTISAPYAPNILAACPCQARSCSPTAGPRRFPRVRRRAFPSVIRSGIARRGGACSRSGIACESCTGSRSTSRMATRSPSWSGPFSPRTPTTTTATSPTPGCGSASRPGRSVRDAPTEEVEAAIRPGGLSPTKAPRIQEILGRLGDHPDLDWLAEAPRAVRARLSDRPSGRRSQDRRGGPPVCLRATRDTRSTPTSTASGAAWDCSGRGRRSMRLTTRCSPSRPPRTPTSCTST